jgi:hypothetical protein
VSANLKQFHDTECPLLSYDDPEFFYLLLQRLREEQERAELLNEIKNGRESNGNKKQKP